METKHTTSELLRQKAEEMLKKTQLIDKSANQVLGADIMKLIHELNVHQVELEMQNDELQQAKSNAEAAARKYTDLYDFAPNGYFTLSSEGVITELNLRAASLLGKSRNYLNGKMLSLYINPASRPTFNDFLKQIFIGKLTETCELALYPVSDMPVHVYLTGNASDNGDQAFITMVDITAMKTVQQKLQESELFLNEAQQVANLGAYTMDVSTGQWKSSKTLDAIFGIDPHFDRSVQGWASLLHPEWQQIMNDYFANEVLGKKTDFDKEYKIVRNNDKVERWLHGIGRLKFDDWGKPIHMVGVIQDITQQKEANEALKASEDYSRALVEALPDLMFVLNSKGVYLDYKAATDDLYYQTGSIVGKNNRDMTPPDFADMIDEKINLALNTWQIQEFEYQMLLPEKGICDFEARMVPCKQDEVIVIVRNITQRKKAEADIILKSEELIAANAEKDQFFSIIAHDLRGPFNGFLGLTQLMAEDLLNFSMDEINKIAVSMQKSANNLYSLLNNLLEWSLLKRGITKCEPIAISVLERLTGVVKSIEQEATKKDIKITVNIPEVIMVHADPNMFESTVRNLISNAVKFTSKGGWVYVSAKAAANNFVEITIKDTGIGMDADMIGNLFHLGQSTNRRGTDNEPSTGLGLLLCEGFIKQHGGTIQVKSETGKGSEFRFTFPGA
jgi:PAS domain S-box-containing protein